MLDQVSGRILKREWPLVLGIGSVKNTYSSRTSTFLSVTIGATLHLDFNIDQGRNPTPGLWWNSRGCPTIVKKWAKPPSWCFPLKQSVQFCLGPVLSGLVTCHDPKLSIPCPRVVSPLSPASEHTQGSNMWGLWLLPPVPTAFPVQPSPRSFPAREGDREGTERDSDQASPCDHCFVLCWREERLQVPGAVILSDRMLMASPVLQASEGPRCLHHSSATIKCWRLPMQAGRGRLWLLL